MAAAFAGKKIRLQSSLLRDERSDLDQSHLYDDDFAPNYSHRIRPTWRRCGILRGIVDNGSVGEIDPGGCRRRRHFESRSASGFQELAFNESADGSRERLFNVESRAQQHRGSNASLSPRRHLTNGIQNRPNSVHLSSSSSLPEQNQSHANKAHEMSQFVQFSSDSDCRLESSCERRLNRLQCLIKAQNKALESQSRKLGQLNCQIESYETTTHWRRISEDGPDYICLAYLGNATDENENENGCSKRNEETKTNELLLVTQEAKHAETAAKDEDRPSTTTDPQITRKSISEPDRELSEVDELKSEFQLLVAIGDSQNRHLLEISDEIAKHDELILEKRLLCAQLEEQLLTNGSYEEINQQNYYFSRDQHPDSADSKGGQVESDFEFEAPRNKRRAVDRNKPPKPFFTLETFLDSDTGLSSLGSESSAEFD